MRFGVFEALPSKITRSVICDSLDAEYPSLRYEPLHRSSTVTTTRLSICAAIICLRHLEPVRLHPSGTRTKPTPKSRFLKAPFIAALDTYPLQWFCCADVFCTFWLIDLMLRILERFLGLFLRGRKWVDFWASFLGPRKTLKNSVSILPSLLWALL